MADETALRPLFDGRSIEGWIQRGGTAEYRVEEGALVGRTASGSPNSFLCPPDNYGDFVLEFETKTDPKLNSGVQIRSHAYESETETIVYNNGPRKRTFPKGRVHGYQVEIANEEGGASGGIYDEARRGWAADIRGDERASKAFRDNEWNRYRVEARGDRIRTWVNDVPCADLVDPLDLDGFLGFQVHGYSGAEPAEVHWRNIRIQDLGRHVWRPLEGWAARGGGTWSVKDGVFSGVAKGGDQPSVMVSNDIYDDFTVRFDYKIVRGNSGFFFRATEDVDRFEGVLGYEVEIDAGRDPGKLQEAGGRWALAEVDQAKAEAHYRRGEWNRVAVSAHGGRIVTHLNGLRTADLADDPGRRKGRLAFQMWSRDNPVEVLFRRLEILEKGS